MTLVTIWFLIWTLLWAIYFMTDGFDLGVGAMLPFLGRSETERRILYNATGPLWDGNEVWLIAAGGVTFAAFPRTYAVMFSAFHEALTLLLLALIVRGLSFELRSKVASARARSLCDLCQFLGSVLVAVLLGVTFANVFRGLPLVNGVHQGTILTLLNPYALAGGAFFLVVFLLHGALWLAIRTESDLHVRAVRTAAVLWPLVLIAAVAFLIYTGFATHLYDNYIRRPVLWAVPLLTVGALITVRVFLNKARPGLAWLASSAMIVAITFSGTIGLYPNMLPSRIDPQTNSITVYQRASSPLTLKIMLGVVLVLVPIVLIYQFWAYRMFSNKINASQLVY
ncbi:MAG: cytochrome d ubiquinol oxidase subunit II [Planctomycetaceae bacterium]|nr:MAG: cytochrome d ubiquinol oxidase subunit II [Planctomycetaceae bacterium]